MRVVPLAAAIACLACSSSSASRVAAPAPAPIVTTVDEFTGEQRTRSQPSTLAGAPDGAARVTLSVLQFTAKGDRAHYYLEFEYFGDTWAFIEENAPLMLLVDGQRLDLQGGASLSGRDVRRGYVREYALFAVQPSQLRQIAAAREVKVRLIGGKFDVDRVFAPETFDRVRSFIAQVLDAAPSVSGSSE